VLRFASTSHNANSLQDLVDLVWPILDDMERAINESHAAAQEALGQSAQGFERCTGAKADGERASAELRESLRGIRESHQSCRQSETEGRSAKEECENVLGTLEGAMRGACEARNAAIKIPNINLVPAPNQNEQYKPWLVRVRDWAIAELQTADQTEEACHESTQARDQKRGECSDLSQKDMAIKDHCDSEQAALESHTCSWASRVEGTCHEYETCYKAFKTESEAQHAEIKHGEEARKSEWWTVRRVRCYFHVFAEANGAAIDPAQIEACKNVGKDAGHLDLEYPSALPGEPSECRPVEEKPCGEAYVTATYGALPSNAKAAECTPCTVDGEVTRMSTVTVLTAVTTFEMMRPQLAPIVR